jgi:hypothetical protein
MPGTGPVQQMLILCLLSLMYKLYVHLIQMLNLDRSGRIVVDGKLLVNLTATARRLRGTTPCDIHGPAPARSHALRSWLWAGEMVTDGARRCYRLDTKPVTQADRWLSQDTKN